MLPITSKELLQAIPHRYSCRQYTGQVVLRELEQRLIGPRGMHYLPQGRCRAEYVHAPGQLDAIFTGVMGSIGKVTGASALIALIVPATDMERGKLQAGYIGQQYALKATHLGLGTCWVGGMFHFKTLMGRLSVGPDEAVVAVLAVGWPQQRTDVLGKLVHSVIRRKSLDQMADSSLRSGPAWLTAALQAVRAAPSAVNLQPWRFSGTPQKVELKPTRKSFFAPIDLGIAMLHFELAAHEGGQNGKWICGEEVHVFQGEGKL